MPSRRMTCPDASGAARRPEAVGSNGTHLFHERVTHLLVGMWRILFVLCRLVSNIHPERP